MKVIFIPGNGGGNPVTDSWFPSLKKALEEHGITVVSEPYPDSVIAREKYWLPHIEKLGAGEDTVLVGHSSGAIAALRYAETHRIRGSVLVSGYHTHLNNLMEIASGYFTRPWDWEAIKANQDFILQFNASDDAFIPLHEAHFLHEKLSSEYLEFSDRGHFLQKEFPELVAAMLAKLAPAVDNLR